MLNKGYPSITLQTHTRKAYLMFKNGDVAPKSETFSINV